MENLIYGFDLGVNSVGWAAIRQYDEGYEILGMGSRIVPSDPNFHGKYYSGNTASKCLERRVKRGIRRSKSRFKQRRDKLKEILIKAGMYDKSLENLPKLDLYALRAKAATGVISLTELGRVFLLINQRRGFKSNRKAVSEDEKQSEYMQRVKQLTGELGEQTIGQRLYTEILDNPDGRIRGRTYLRQDYQREFNRIWDVQQKHHPTLTGQPEHRDYESLYWRIATEIIFYQRPLKSAKGLINKCTFEKNLRVCPVSSPYYQSFVVYQKINDLILTNTRTREKRKLTFEERDKLLKALTDSHYVNTKDIMTNKNVLKALGYEADQMKVNFTEIIADKTYMKLKRVLKAAGIESSDHLLKYDYRLSEQALMAEANLYSLWHTLYSVEDEEAVIRILQNKFSMSPEQAETVAAKAVFNPDFGKLSSKAIKKLLPHLRKGKQYNEACDEVGYDHSGHKTVQEIKDKLRLLKPNSLRNPVVEQIINQLTNVVNTMIDTYGSPDIIRVELARELKNSAKQRSNMTKQMSQNKKRNDSASETLKNEYGIYHINGRDVARFKLWEETDRHCLYCGKPISASDLLNGQADVDHILPRSRSFNDSMQNKLISHVSCNRLKNQNTAYDYVASQGLDRLREYELKVNELFNKESGTRISRAKNAYLLMTGDEIPDDFVNRQLRDTSYIVVEAVRHLKRICTSVNTSTGTVTDYLRDEWGLKDLLKELTLPIYQKAGKTVTKEIKLSDGTTKTIVVPDNWTKRNDQRHHAIDALVTAFTGPKIIYLLNNRNKLYQYQKEAMSDTEKAKIAEEYERETGEPFKLHSFTQSAQREGLKVPPPIPDLRRQVKKFLSQMLISIKKTKSKAVSVKINKPKGAKVSQITLVPRGSLHEDTVRGIVKYYQKEILSPRFDKIDDIVDPQLAEIIRQRIAQYGNAKTAFSKATMTKDPVMYNGKEIKEVTVFINRYTKRVDINSLTDAQVKKIVDPAIRDLIESRIVQHNGKLKDMQKDLPNNLIYADKHHKRAIKKVKVWDDGSYIPLRHYDNGVVKKPIDYVASGNNHHALVYRDQEGKYSSRLISLYDATSLARILHDEHGKPVTVIDRTPHPDTGAAFYMSLQINDLVFLDMPEDIFIDSNAPEDKATLSSRLFRIQKMSLTGNSLYLNLRHHLESSVDDESKELRGITWERIQSDVHLHRLQKVKINHLGKIIGLAYD